MSAATDVDVRDETDLSHSDEVPCEYRAAHEGGPVPAAVWKIEFKCPACATRYRGRHCDPCTSWFMSQPVFTCSNCHVSAYTERWGVSLCPLTW